MNKRVHDPAKRMFRAKKEERAEASVLPLLILGTRTFAVEVADLVSEIPHLQLAGFVENLERERCRETLTGIVLLWLRPGNVMESPSTGLRTRRCRG